IGTRESNGFGASGSLGRGRGTRGADDSRQLHAKLFDVQQRHGQHQHTPLQGRKVQCDMKIEILPLDFIGPQGALLELADPKLHDMAVDYCARELAGGQDLNLSKFTKVWLAVEMDQDQYQAIIGIT